MSSTMTAKEAFWRQWRNGGRRLILISAVCFAVVMALNTWLLVTIVRDDPILQNVVPQLVLTSDVVAGGELVVEGTKCNRTDRPVVVFSTSYYTPVDPPGQSVISTQGSAVREPGCTTREFKRVVPLTLKPGTYRVGGTDVVVDQGGKVSNTGWYSELFKVSDAAQP